MKKLKASRKLTLLITIVVTLTAIFALWADKESTVRLEEPYKVAITSNPCVRLAPESGPYQEAVIWSPGNYCVDTDFWQKRLYNGAGHSGPAEYRHLIAVRSSDVVIDLSNRILHSDGHSSGIAISFDEYNKNEKLPEEMHIGKRITIKNGIIDLRGLGVAAYNLNRWSMRKIDEQIPENLHNYPHSKIILDNILIKTDNIGIALEGDGNIVRNCIIESGGIAAITMAGQNGEIRNNRIILTNPLIPGNMRGTKFRQPKDFFELLKSRSEPRAAIVLHQAKDTVISGNVIEVKGNSEAHHNIYLTDSSTNIRIEGNKFLGDDDPIRLVNGSTAAMKNNVFEFKKPWWKF